MRNICDLFLYLCDHKDIQKKLEETPSQLKAAAEPLLLGPEEKKKVQEDVNSALQATTANVEEFRKKLQPEDGRTQIENRVATSSCDLSSGANT